MKKNIKITVIFLLLLFSASSLSAYTLSGEITGGVFLGGITYIYAIATELPDTTREFYIGLSLLGVGNYSIFNVPAGIISSMLTRTGIIT